MLVCRLNAVASEGEVVKINAAAGQLLLRNFGGLLSHLGSLVYSGLYIYIYICIARGWAQHQRRVYPDRWWHERPTSRLTACYQQQGSFKGAPLSVVSLRGVAPGKPYVACWACPSRCMSALEAHVGFDGLVSAPAGRQAGRRVP